MSLPRAFLVRSTSVSGIHWHPQRLPGHEPTYAVQQIVPIRSPRRRGRAAWTAIRVSQAMSPEVKVELPRLAPCGVTSNEVTRDNKVVRCAKDTVAQWNVRYGQARK
jgi:hypothetical protein